MGRPHDSDVKHTVPAWQPPVCADCGSERLQDFAGYTFTGVFAPDGYEERFYEEGTRCLDCGFTDYTW
jgi:hypothetical protein